MRTRALIIHSFLTAAEAEEDRVLAELLEANATASSVVARVANATLAAVKISASAANQSGGLLTLPVTGTKAEISVPAALFADLAVQDAALVVSVLDPAAAHAMSGQEGAQAVEVKAAANVNLVETPTRNRIGVAGLSEPILVVLPVSASAGLECAYWDELQHIWATDGLSTAEPTPDGLLQCRTTHLTLFAGILRGFLSTYECSQGAELFNAEAIAMMAQGDWHRSAGAILLWSVLSLLSAGLLFSRCLDLKRKRDGSWSDEHFLIPMGTEKDTPPATKASTPANTESTGLDGSKGTAGEEVQEKPPRCGILATIIWCPAMAVCTCFRWMRESSAFRDVLDDVVSNWIANFSEIRDALESFWEGLELFVHKSHEEDGGWAVAVIHAIMRSLLLSTARRQACASMRLSSNDVAFVMHEEDLLDILVSRHERHSMWLRADEPCVQALPDGSSLALCSFRARRLSAALESRADRAAGPDSVPEASANSGLVPAADCLANLGSEASSMYSACSKHFCVRPRCAEHRASVRAAWQPEACSKQTLGREEGWGQLHDDVNDHLDMHITNTGLWRSVPCAIARLFMVENPVGKSMAKSVFMTSALRFFLFVLEIFGALLMTTAFYQASGNAVGRKARARCGKGSAGPWDQVGRTLAIGVGSLVVAAIPVMILGSLHSRRLKKLPYEGSPEWQRQLYIWRIEDVVIWVLGFLCLGACTFFTCLFLANVSEQDTQTWAVSAGITISLNCVILPLMISIVVPVLAAALLSFVSIARRLPKAELIRRSHAALKNGNLTPPLVYI